jgi:hypothetical protein
VDFIVRQKQVDVAEALSIMRDFNNVRNQSVDAWSRMQTGTQNVSK